MTPHEAFFTVHRDLPREGPGTVDDVIWALDVTETASGVQIADLACGPGADTVTLAKARPQARIAAYDLQQHFADQSRLATAQFGDNVSVLKGDMLQIDGKYDLIWCAGAVYIVGIENALNTWRNNLKPGGRVAFSEPVLLSSDPAPAVKEFWQEYSAASDLDGIKARVSATGWQVLDTRIITGPGWVDYYLPMEARIANLRQSPVPDVLEKALDEAEHEIALWRQAPDDIAYALCVVAPA
jgi:SAM-dependent methyltransferase